MAGWQARPEAARAAAAAEGAVREASVPLS